MNAHLFAFIISPGSPDISPGLSARFPRPHPRPVGPVPQTSPPAYRPPPLHEWRGGSESDITKIKTFILLIGKEANCLNGVCECKSPYTKVWISEKERCQLPTA